MEDLLFEFNQKLSFTSLAFQRYLINEIDLDNRLIAIKGARGSGKTTMILQIAKNHSDIGHIAFRICYNRNPLSHF